MEAARFPSEGKGVAAVSSTAQRQVGGQGAASRGHGWMARPPQAALIPLGFIPRGLPRSEYARDPQGLNGDG